MSKKILFSAACVFILLGLGLFFQHRKKPDGQLFESEKIAVQSAPTLAPLPVGVKGILTVRGLSGGGRTLHVLNKTGLAELPIMETIASVNGIEVLKPVSTTTEQLEELFFLDEGIQELNKTSILANCLIGQTNTEIFYFASSRHASFGRVTDLNELRAFDPKAWTERTLAILPEGQSYTKTVSELLMTPSGTGSIQNKAIRAEVYFQGPYIFPGQMRLPIEIHTIPLSAHVER